MKINNKIIAAIIAAPLLTSSFGLMAMPSGDSPRLTKDFDRSYEDQSSKDAFSLKLIKKFDSNQDDKLDVDEFIKMNEIIKASKESKRDLRMAEVFKEVDSNKDGVITFDEFKSFKPDNKDRNNRKSKDSNHERLEGKDHQEGADCSLDDSHKHSDKTGKKDHGKHAGEDRDSIKGDGHEKPNKDNEPKSLDQVFENLDKNNDGFIDIKEISEINPKKLFR